MADQEWIDIPVVINPNDPEPEAEPVEAIAAELENGEEEDFDPVEIEENEEPEEDHIMPMAEHEEIIEIIANYAAGQIQTANNRAAAAESQLAAERETTSRLRQLLQRAQMDRIAIQARLERVIEGCHHSFSELERRVLRYPVEEGRRSYFIDRSVVLHMIWETYDHARGT